MELAMDKAHQIILLSRNIKRLKDLASRCNQLAGNEIAFPVEFDLSDSEGIKDTLPEEISKINGSLDVLVNNAGALIRKPFMEIGCEESKVLFDVNFFAPFFLIQSLLPLLKKSPAPSIINVTSMAAVQGSSKFKGLSMYSASKGALATLTECLAEEFADTGIRINALAFGAVQTEMLAEAFPGYNAPLEAAEMGKFFKWFVLEGSRYFNGKMLPVSVSTP
jgi:NAD(P)-dependent dehydrogenase (short-subunit alcohol dehydrogenase family)